MSDRTIARQYLVHNLFEVLASFDTKEEADTYARSARGFFDTVVVETRKANR